VDGTHCVTRELKHPFLSKDLKLYSHKFHKPGVDYEIALDLWKDRVVWVNGPFPASEGNLTIFREKGLKDKIPFGMLGVGENGYRGGGGVLSTPTLKTQKNCESSSAEYDRAKKLSMLLRVKTLRLLTLDSATKSRSTNKSLKRSALSSNTKWSSDPLCSRFKNLGLWDFIYLLLAILQALPPRCVHRQVELLLHKSHHSYQGSDSQ
jgi:hypothetical protein